MGRTTRHDLPPTERELVLLRALVEHGTIEAAADALGVSRHSVDARLDDLRWKANCRYLPQLVDYAWQQGWLTK